MAVAKTAFTVSCNKITDKTTFIKGLQNAGLHIEPEDAVEDSEVVRITFQNREPGQQVVKALDRCRLEGKTLKMIHKGPPRTITKGHGLDHPIPSVDAIHRALSDAFHEEAVRLDLGKGGCDSAAAVQGARQNIPATDSSDSY